jgi:hypothetical protein
MERLRDEFPEYINDTTKPGELESGGLARIARDAFNDLIAKAVSDADAGKAQADKRRAEQVCFFRYRDGAPMCTLAWVIVSDATQEALDQANLPALPFYKNDAESFDIRIPKVTPYEIREMERHLPNLGGNGNLDWIPPSDRISFESIYRFLPTFGIFEPI